MTKTKVTPLIRMVFLFWLIVSIALLGTANSTLLSLPDWRHGHETKEPGFTVEIDFNSFDSIGATCSHRL